MIYGLCDDGNNLRRDYGRMTAVTPDHICLVISSRVASSHRLARCCVCIRLYTIKANGK